VGLTSLTVEFKASENLKNYFVLYNWIQMLRYHVQGVDGDRLRDNVIKSIDVTFLDNKKNLVGRFRFRNAIIINLGALSLNMGSAEEVTFPVSFEFEELQLVTESN